MQDWVFRLGFFGYFNALKTYGGLSFSLSACLCIHFYWLSWLSPNISTTPITAMGCRQCLPLSVVQLKGKHCRKPHCRYGVVDTFGLRQASHRKLIQNSALRLRRFNILTCPILIFIKSIHTSCHFGRQSNVEIFVYFIVFCHNQKEG